MEGGVHTTIPWPDVTGHFSPSSQMILFSRSPSVQVFDVRRWVLSGYHDGISGPDKTACDDDSIMFTFI